MEEPTDLAWCGCGAATPLALLAQRTRTAPVKTDTRDHAQAPIGFSAVFLWEELLVGRNLDRMGKKPAGMPLLPGVDRL
jgi:hypothetical protein